MTARDVRELHASDGPDPLACDYCGDIYPCPTIRALDAEERFDLADVAHEFGVDLDERISVNPGQFVISARVACRRAAEVLRAQLVDQERKQPDTGPMTDPDSPLHRPTWCVEHGPHGEHRNTFGQVTLSQPVGGEPRIELAGPSLTLPSGIGATVEMRSVDEAAQLVVDLIAAVEAAQEEP